MGAKQTKIEGSYLPETPTATIKHEQAKKEEATVDKDDPRSPGALRTPIASLRAHGELVPQQEGTLSLPLAVLRKRFFKAAFSYNLNDPRSPTVQLNRTPLIFEEQHERSLDLDDTFADLFIDSKGKSANEAKETAPIEALTTLTQTNTIERTNEAIEDAQQKEIAEFLCKLEQTPSVKQLDPRSPTIGVERTPLIFNDDDNAEVIENALLERVLATLSFNGNDSELSNGHAMEQVDMDTMDATIPQKLSNPKKRPANKHLERVRVCKKRVSSVDETHTSTPRPRVFEDMENNPFGTDTTPKSKRKTETFNKRTPLSCMKNRSNLRSRSVDASTKSIKERLALTSFDDSLNLRQSIQAREQ